MDKFEYQPATLNASTVKMDGPRGFAGTAENVRSREWAREFGKRNLMSAVRLAREVEVDFVADFETMDALREAADADLYNLTPGTFIAQGEWKQRGYVLQSMPKGIHFGWVNTSLVLALLDGAWWRLQGVSLVPPSTDPPETRYGSGTGASVRMAGAVDSEFTSLTIYGKSVQSGTPTPSNPVPVQVVGTQNLLEVTAVSTTIRGVTFTVSDGIVTANNQASGGNATLTLGTVVLPAGTYTISGITGGSGTTYALRIYNASASSTIQYFYNTGTLTLSAETNVGAQLYVYNGYTADNLVAKPQIEKGATETPYMPYGFIGLNCGGIQTPIDLQGNKLCSLPDGTRDELAIDGDGAAEITKNVLHTTQAVTDGVTGTVGVDVLSSTGEIANGADVYYAAASPQTVSLDPVTLPTIAPNASITVTAAVVPEVNAVFEPGLHSLRVLGSTISRLPGAGVSVMDSLNGYNLIPFDKAAIKSYNTSGAWNADTYTYRGISATLNNDGTITLNGTATGNFTLYLCPNANQITLLQGNYILTGDVPGTGSDSTWYFQATTTTDASGTVQARNRDYGAGVTLTVNQSTYGVAVYFHASSGDTFDNAVLKPQLTRKGTSSYYPDPEMDVAQQFVPYGCLCLKVGDSVTPINLGGYELAGFYTKLAKKDELTIDSGGNVTLTKRVKTVDLGSFTWEKISDGSLNFRTTTAVTDIPLTESESEQPKCDCDLFGSKSYSAAVSDSFGWASTIVGAFGASTDWGKVCIAYANGAQMSAAEFKSYVSGMKLYYPEPTEQVIALDPITMPGIADNIEVSLKGRHNYVMRVSPTVEWQLVESHDYDYPHDYATDYQRPTTGGSVDTGRLVPCKPRITFFGPVVDPEITIAGNKYKVTGSVAAGARIEIDGKEKTVKLIAQDGTVTDKFADALRGTGEGGGEYIFEQIPPGTHAVTWDATFGVDIQWYDEVGEPPWSQS